MSNLDSFVVLTIPTSETTNPDVGLLDILHIINKSIPAELVWGIERVECAGLEAQTFLDKLDASPGGRLLIAGDELLKLAFICEQIIDGTFVGYPSEVSANEFLAAGWTPGRFIGSTAEIAISAVDGSWFDVYMRSRMHGEQLAQHFEGTTWEDPAEYQL